MGPSLSLIPNVPERLLPGPVGDKPSGPTCTGRARSSAHTQLHTGRHWEGGVWCQVATALHTGAPVTQSLLPGIGQGGEHSPATHRGLGATGTRVLPTAPGQASGPPPCPHTAREDRSPHPVSVALTRGVPGAPDCGRLSRRGFLPDHGAKVVLVTDLVGLCQEGGERQGAQCWCRSAVRPPPRTSTLTRGVPRPRGSGAEH